MTPLKSLSSDISQKQWLKACKKLGLKVDKIAGHGSHAIVKCPQNPIGRPITIQNHINRLISVEIYKSLKNLGFSEEDIDKALK